MKRRIDQIRSTSRRFARANRTDRGRKASWIIGEIELLFEKEVRKNEARFLRELDRFFYDLRKLGVTHRL